MIMITKLIMIGIAIVCAVTLAFIALEFVEDKVISKFSKKRNRVHFYVARDKDCSLWIYIGKPTRGSRMFYQNDRCRILGKLTYLYMLGLDENDYANLKWEDGPVEVFLNIED